MRKVVFARGTLARGTLARTVFARGAIALHDAFAVLAIATILVAGFAAPAYAYVDPSVMTYTIQALAGVAVALSAVAGVAFRRTRKALFKALNIDENARKVKDAAWERTAPATAVPTVHAGEKDFIAAAAQGAEALRRSTEQERSTAAEKAARPLSWPKRFLIALLAVGLPAFTAGIVAPFEIVAGNLDALSYSLSDVAGYLAAAIAAATLVCALALSLFRGKAFRTLCVLCVTVGVCFWVQAMFLNSGMPVMNGTAIDYWGQHATMMVVSALVWLALFALAIFALIKRPKLAQTTALVLAGALIIVQGVGVASLFGKEDTNVFVTEDGLYDVNTGRGDVIVFVLDHFDTKFFYDVRDEFPEALAELEGFTWYTDDSGMMVPTLFAVPYLLTGETPEVGQDIHEYYRTRYLDSTLIDDLTSTGYTLGLYTSDLQEGYFTSEEVQALFADRTVNVHELDSLSINPVNAVKILLRAALFRDMPWALKQPFWFYTDALNQRVLNMDTVSYDAEGNLVLGDPAQTPYIIDDVLRKTELEAFGLSVTNGIGTVKFIHLNGAHLPFTMNLAGERVPQDSVTQTEQAAGALAIVGEYLRMMKELGAYENATIVITADHGDWVASHELTTMVSCPVMLVKQRGDMWSDLRISDKQISHANLIATLVEAVGADASAYGPTLADAPQEAARLTYHITTIEDRVKEVWEFEVVGDANDIANWRYTGNHWLVEGGVAD